MMPSCEFNPDPPRVLYALVHIRHQLTTTGKSIVREILCPNCSLVFELPLTTDTYHDIGSACPTCYANIVFAGVVACSTYVDVVEASL